MQSLVEFLNRAVRRGELRFLLIGGRSLEAHGLVRFTKDVDFLVATQDIPVISGLLMKSGYQMTAETAIFSRWKHPSMMADDVDVMYVKPETFEKLLEGSKLFEIGDVTLRVPSVPSLSALKLHAMRSNAERLEKDGRDIAELLKLNPGILDKDSLEKLFCEIWVRPSLPSIQPPRLMISPSYLELDLPVVTEWLPDNDKLPAEIIDTWIQREQAMRWKPGEDRHSPLPANEMFSFD